MVTCWIVTWRYRGVRRLIDFSDEASAVKFAQALAESNDREDVAVTSVEYEADPERAERIWGRIQGRIAEEWAMRAMA